MSFLKNLFLALIIFVFSLPSFAVCRGLTECLEPGEALVTGTFTFSAQKRNFPSSLKDLYKGRSSSVNFSKQGKTVKVYGKYDGSSNLLLEEEGEFSKDLGRYEFLIDIPGMMNVVSDTLVKETFDTGYLFVRFYNLITDNGNDNDGESSVSSIISNLPISVSKTMSVSKIIATRKGKKGTLKGFFNALGSAKGRFTLKFQYN